MRRIFQGSKQNMATTGAVEKDLKGAVFNVSGLHVSIENKIAEGGFSFVYVVRCNKTNRFYALKRQFVNESRLLEACKREIEITRTLGTHPNIVGYVSSSLKAGPDGVYEYLLVTDYYKDSVLQLMNDRLAAGKHLTVREILRIFGDVCCAVARLHHCQTPVIHRDLKVENLLLEPTTSSKSGSSSERSSSKHHHHHSAHPHSTSAFPFSCVLCDFGSCTTRHVVPGDQSSSNSGSMAALQDEIARFTTLSYRAPELVDLYSGFPITTKVDIWALGVMLFKLCFFTLPFGESTLAIQSATFSFPSEPSYPAELLGLIIYLLNPDPHKRPDIFQVASAVFCLLGLECPVKNLNNIEAVSIQYIVQLYANFQNKTRGISDSTDYCNNRAATTPTKLSNSSSQKSDLNVINKSTTTQVQPEILNSTSSTSVVPRQRPRVQQQTAISPANAFTLINNKAENAVGPWKSKQKTPSAADTISTSSQSMKENKTPSNFANPNYAVQLQDDEKNDQSRGKTTDIKSDQIEIQETYRLSAGDTMQGHRRNISDPSTAAIETERCSAFRPYHSQHQVSVPSAQPPSVRTSAKTPPQTLDTSSTRSVAVSGGPQHPLTLSPSWNPFDLDDQSFGVHFDELPRRRGSASSIANVKSRESLVMEDIDPFGAAPFPVVDNGQKSNQKTLLNTLNLTLNPEKFASPSKKVSKYEKLVNYLDDMGQEYYKKDKNDKPHHHNQQKVAPEDRRTNLSVPPLNQKCRIDDASSSGVKYKAMGNHRSTAAIRGPAKDSEADSVGSASDLQARMQVSSTTDEDASDNGDASRRRQRRRRDKRRTGESAVDGHDNGDQGSENADSSPTDEDDEKYVAKNEGGNDDDGNVNDNSSYDLDLNLDPKDLDEGETTTADISAAGRRPLLQAGDDLDDENDFSPGASFSSAPALFLQENFRQKQSGHLYHRSSANEDENLEMNVFSPTSIDTIVTMRQNFEAMRIDNDKRAAATIASGDFGSHRTAPSPIFPVQSEQRCSSSSNVKKIVDANVAAVSTDIFADAPFQFSAAIKKSSPPTTSPPIASSDYVDEKSSDDEAALVTTSPKKQAGGSGVKSSTVIKSQQSKPEDLQLSSNQYQKLRSGMSASTSGPGSNLLAKVMIVDQNQSMNKKSAFVNTSFQGDDNFVNK